VKNSLDRDVNISGYVRYICVTSMDICLHVWLQARQGSFRSWKSKHISQCAGHRTIKPIKMK
jgi:hypothetical protein